jgi:hypothetical protein
VIGIDHTLVSTAGDCELPQECVIRSYNVVASVVCSHKDVAVFIRIETADSIPESFAIPLSGVHAWVSDSIPAVPEVLR